MLVIASKNGPVCSCILRGIVHSSQHIVHSWTSPFLFQTLGSHWRLAEPGRQGGHQTVATPLRWTQEPVQEKFISPNNCFVCVCVCGLWYPALQCSCGGEPGTRLQTPNTSVFLSQIKVLITVLHSLVILRNQEAILIKCLMKTVKEHDWKCDVRNTSKDKLISQCTSEQLQTTVDHYTVLSVYTLFLEERLTVAISRTSVSSSLVLAKRELLSSSSDVLAMAELSSHSNRTPPAINTRYTHHKRKRMSSQNKITSF